MIKNNKRSGFTLIELLVVIAIIGILSGIVISSVGTARQRANDAAVKSNLAGIRAQAEIVYGGVTPNSYNTVCNATQDPTIARSITAANSAGGGTATCNSSATAWAIALALPSGGAYCVDSTGVAKSTQGSGSTAYTGQTGAGATVAITTGAFVCN